MAAARTRRPAEPVTRAALMSALIGTLLIAVAAFWLSFSALTDLAARAGVPRDQAWVWPLVLDGIIVVSTVSVFALSGHGRAVSSYPWLLLLGSTAVSVVGNGTHAALTHGSGTPALVAIGVSAVPPVALVTSTHLSVVLLGRAAPAPSRERSVSGPSSGSASTLSAVLSAPPSGVRAGARALTDEVLSAWVAEQERAGHVPTGATVASAFGVSPATGRRRLAGLRSTDRQEQPTAV